MKYIVKYKLAEGLNDKYGRYLNQNTYYKSLKNSKELETFVKNDDYIVLAIYVDKEPIWLGKKEREVIKNER